MGEAVDWEARCAGALAGAAILRSDLAAALARLESAEEERDRLREAFDAKRLTADGRGCVQVGETDCGEVILQLPGEVGWIAFSPDEADQLAALMNRKAEAARAVCERSGG